MVPELRSQADWDKWNNALRVVLNACDPRIWNLIEGTAERPTVILSEEEISQHLASKKRKLPEAVTKDEVSRYKTTAQNAHNAWKMLEARGLLLLSSTLGPKPRKLISGITSIAAAYREVQDWCESPTWPRNCWLWTEWTSLWFEEKDSAEEFVEHWQIFLDDLQSVSDEISPFVQFHVFMEAISHHPGTVDFHENLSWESYDDLPMAIVIGKFLTFMSERWSCCGTSCEQHSLEGRD